MWQWTAMQIVFESAWLWTATLAGFHFSRLSPSDLDIEWTILILLLSKGYIVTNAKTTKVIVKSLYFYKAFGRIPPIFTNSE